MWLHGYASELVKLQYLGRYLGQTKLDKTLSAPDHPTGCVVEMPLSCLFLGCMCAYTPCQIQAHHYFNNE